MSNARELVKKLTDTDPAIQKAKNDLNQEISKAERAIASNNTAEIQALQTPFDTKISQVEHQLTEFNKEKAIKFNDLKQTRNQIDEFIKANKNNQNYSTLISQLTNAKESKKSVSDSSNKSEIENANEALKQALATAQSAKNQADKSNTDTKSKLNASLSNARELVKN
ncbi:hypothetical protein [Metamycoplasma hominis]|uniref:hypothetical protein n=1 Tax=Metamycoplasma hominis TaxID=2098 RepID=UPI0023AA5643|nr:hypothetical protein [Metamycoplasma hominis]